MIVALTALSLLVVPILGYGSEYRVKDLACGLSVPKELFDWQQRPKAADHPGSSAGCAGRPGPWRDPMLLA